ncbi:hypothetical protein EYF80_025796 [Liparis tanakae]|uniref:Uncharacterized protein n=1 Tax=Liparis tanakae TaxID=230148 RepID=A0A4Z2HGA1_9TELE|nr:hypothetical protein EYF80_025796 [Liparis tanakae]
MTIRHRSLNDPVFVYLRVGLHKGAGGTEAWRVESRDTVCSLKLWSNIDEMFHNKIKPTEDDERQLHPDGRESVEQEGSDDASDVTQGGADRHAQVPTGNTTSSR